MNRRTLRLPTLAAIALTLALVATACTKNAESWESSQLINAERNNRGIPELQLDQALIEKAQGWADWMAATGSVSHSNLRQGAPGFRYLAENVGWARSVGEMHSLFMASSSHRSSILDRKYTKYGTGVTIVNGRFYVVQVFGG